MKNNNIYNRIIAASLCLVMLVGAVLSFSACKKEQEDEDTRTPTTAVRFVQDAAKGEKISRSDIEIINVYTSDIPEGTYTAETEVIGKYLLTDICSGDFAVASKITDEKPATDVDYVIATENGVKAGTDISVTLQALIDKNPGRTIYFPDGTYKLSKSVKTSADPAKSVSFVCSTYTVFEASNWTEDKDVAMIRLGAIPYDGADDEMAAGSCSFTGGVINASKLCAGISVEGGRNALIHNVSMKETTVGIHLKADYADVDNVVIIGDNTKTSIGVLVDGKYNTVQTMRIYRINTGIWAKGEQNIFRNLHPLYSPGSSGASYESTGFRDTSSGNFYDMCYSDQFTSGFKVDGHTYSTFNNCFAFWYSTAKGMDIHIGIASTGEFNSIVRTSRFDLKADAKEACYLKAEVKAGSGFVIDPICGGINNDKSGDYKLFLQGTVHS